MASDTEYVFAHLERFRDGLLSQVDLRGLYLYGSLTTDDFSPATSDIDVIAVVDPSPGTTAREGLEDLHLSLATAGGACERLNCLYVQAGTLSDPERLHPYWFGDRFTRWQVKVMTMVELTHSGRALHGPWPPAGLPEVSLAELQAHVREHTRDYWPEVLERDAFWLADMAVDHALVALPRVAAVLRDGELITKSQAIGHLADFGVPDWLSDEIRRRRAGEDVHVTEQHRLTRARLSQQIMAAGIGRLTGPGAPGDTQAR